MRVFCALVLACLLLGAQARADAAAVAGEAAALLAEAEASLAKARRAATTRAALGRSIRAYETALVAANAGLSALRAESAALAERLTGHGQLLADIQSALRQIEAVPPELRIEQTGGAVTAARTAMLLGHLQPQIQERVAALQGELDRLATMSALQIAFADDIRAAMAQVAQARAELESPSGVITEARANLLRTSRDLASLARSLEGQKSAAVGQTNDGAWTWPVSGELLREFGEADAAGIARPGLVLSAAQGALVTAPLAATVRFTGPFLDHGQVVILAPGSDRLVILAGMARVLVVTGEIVEQGAPLGLMPGGDTGDEDFLIANAAGDDAFLNQSLYVEFRKSGIAENPVALFGAGGRAER